MTTMELDSRAETLPLKTLDELLNWIPELASGCPAAVSLPERNAWSENKCQRRTLMCHDMQGGYLCDRFTNGCRTEPHEPYIFYHWASIHAFIYFSHNLVTIPPTGWINAAHKNGVSVFGTFITEWDDGKAIWQRLLNDENLLTRVASLLVQIADYYGFEGWLINIENSIEPENVDQVVNFLRLLHQRSRLVCHRPQKPLSVIWYDSITIKGSLKWQNCLNEENMKFFHVVDGIFLNYNWSLSDLAKAKKTATPYRKYDVFVGVDVFGRGCYGGGGWNTNLALEVINDHDMSVALFAPGWVLECNEKDKFFDNQNKFWDTIAPFLPQHKIYSLPLHTTFCAGYGHCRHRAGQKDNGMAEGDGMWVNLSEQGLQPLWSNGECHSDNCYRMRLCHQDSWHGSSSLEILFPPKSDQECVLFACAAPLQSSLLVEVTAKLPFDGNNQFALILSIRKRLVTRKIRLHLSEQNAAVNDCSPCTVYPTAIARTASSADDWWTFRYDVDDIVTASTVLENVSFLVSTTSEHAVRLLLGELKIQAGIRLPALSVPVATGT
ncbi:cytosolic endo-beta-N-acetylglucosaminidase-like [Paramacrobiotus metropolitanus]|uniref:cytosolic endo-beta-N-acetylglucosaminidase-like n=1 Tax=Paramacrobiotus metropolitanus TaxID=2943436 RepID=UPI0024460D58|nr:cytosolic endo-beta-N-acetylglucosaminidase-like [Paramacrobiotus metropolitanus]